MEQKNVSATNFIPLQPPYKIIKYSNKMGVQIGIQMVTYSVSNSLRTETYNYPAVAVEDTITPYDNREVSFDGQGGFEVWDGIETKKVSVLGFAGEPLSWMDFIKVLWHDYDRTNKTGARFNKVFIYNKLQKYNSSPKILRRGTYTIHLHVKSSAGKPQVVCSSRDDVFAIWAKWSDDVKELEKGLVTDLMDYLLIISPSCSARGWYLVYETDDERLRQLVDRLNMNIKATAFKKTLTTSLLITGILPYEDDEVTHVSPESPSLSAENETEEESLSLEKTDKDVPTIFKPNLNVDKIQKALSNIKESRNKPNGIPFWYVVYNFFSTIGWLEITKQTRFIAWVETNFGWERKRKYFKRIDKRFKQSFEAWSVNSRTDKEYIDLANKLRNTYQQQKRDGSWEDRDIYYKENKIHYN